jgi:predicted nucleic acid-binding Zn finger protein
MEGQADARVTKIYKSKKQYLVSTTSRYCENLRRAHGSNHVWFFVSGDIIVQKCFCKCDTIRERVDGFCKDFVGKKYKLTHDLYKMLYPTPVVVPEINTKPKKKAPTFDHVKPELEEFIQKFFP